MSGDTVEVVQAGPEDLQAILPLMVAFNAHEAIPWRPEAMGAALARFLRDPALGFLLLARERASGAVRGYGMATFGYDLEFAGRDAFITEVFVDDAFAGQGLGRALLDALVEQLRSAGIKAVHLMVRPENERARALYETRGFKQVPRIVMTKVL